MKTMQLTSKQITRLSKQIAKDLLTVNLGRKGTETGDRLAIMKGSWWKESNLGGRNRVCIETTVAESINQFLARSRKQE